MNGSPLLLLIGLRCAWIAVYVAILIVHIGHGVSTRGATRAWHAGHCAMALAMAWIFVPRALAPLLAGIGQAAFGAIALAIALVVACDWHRQRRLAFVADRRFGDGLYACPARGRRWAADRRSERVFRR